MSLLCERPGCSEPGAAAYGMIPEDLLFWIAPLARSADPDQNVLCRRHADAMVVPRGWTLDDRREEVPRLFKPRPVPAARTNPAAPRSTTKRPSRKAEPDHSAPAVEQLILDGTADIPRPPADQIADLDDAADSDTATPEVESTAAVSPAVELPWSPAFDQADDLDGLLQVDSPLLARAFRGTGRPRD